MKKLISSMLFLLLSSLLISQTISLEEIKKAVEETHPIFAAESITPEILKAEQESLLGAQDWLISGKSYYNHTEYDFLNPAINSSDQFCSEAGISKTIWETGGLVKASLSTEFTDFNHQAIPNSYFGNEISLAYYHPLMKNRNGFLNKFEYELKNFDRDLNELQSKQILEAVIKNVSSLFIEWSSLLAQKEIFRNRLTLSLEQVNLTNEKYKENLIEKVDLMRAEENTREIQVGIVILENRVAAVVSRLAKLSGVPDLYTFSPEFNVHQLPDVPEYATEIEYLKHHNQQLKILDIQQQQNQFIKKGFAEQLKPDLQIFAEVDLSSKEEYLPESFLLDNPSTTIGATISFPFGNRTSKAKMCETTLKITKIEREKETLIHDYEAEISSLIVQLERMQSIFDLNSKRLDASQQRTAEEQKLYEKGLGDISALLLSQDNEARIRLENLTHIMTYHNLILELDYLQGRLYKEESWEK